MIRDAAPDEWAALAAGLEPPVLIVSTRVGRGMYSLGEAIRERIAERGPVGHVAVEDLLAPAALAEDVERYHRICRHAPSLLWLPYTFPWFYRRKYLREKQGRRTSVARLAEAIRGSGAKTVICVSHRPAFWVSCFKARAAAAFRLIGVMGEFGRNLGWKYLFWESMDGILSPLGRADLDGIVPEAVPLRRVDLPARRQFGELAASPGDPEKLLVMGGYWGLGPLPAILGRLRRALPALRLYVVCGENREARRAIERTFVRAPVVVMGAVPSIVPLLRECGAVVTRPGISSLVECHAARRQLFLLEGLPVIEAANATYARRHFGARDFSPGEVRRWLAHQS